MVSKYAKGMNNQWSKIIKILPEEHFAVFIDSIFSRTELLKMVASLGLSYPGMRLTSIPQYEIINALVDEFYDNPEKGKEIVKILRKKVVHQSDEIGKVMVADLKKHLNELVKKEPSPKEIYMTIFALLLDEREIIEEIAWFLDLILRKKPKKEINLEELVEREKRLSALLSEKDEINKKLNEALALIREENKKLNKNLSEAKNRTENLEEEVLHLNSLKQKYSEPIELKHLEKNFEKILYSVEKILQNENNLLGFPERLEITILKQFSEMKKVIDEIIINEQKNYINLKNTIVEELKKQTTGFKPPPKEEPKKTIQERIAVFVDAENLYRSAKECFNGRINYEKLLSLIVGPGRYLVKACAYVVKALEGDAKPFITSLEKIGYETKMKEPRYRSDGTAKANWDMGIALDILGLLDKIDTIVLASGDGDFVPLVNYIKAKGKKVEVYSFPKNTAYDLQELADFFYPLDEKIALI